MKPKFRFQDLEIWRDACEIALQLFEIADRLEDQKLFRFADQLRGVALSIPNNISESTGTDAAGEQRQLLRYSKRECFEGANMVILLNRRNVILKNERDELLEKLDILSRRITAYSRVLGSRQLPPT